jgi:hypothetical protein
MDPLSWITPVADGLGQDFLIIWKTGLAVLQGNSPYSVTLAWYPPATSYLFALLSLMPLTTSFILWTTIQILLLIKITGKKALGWVLFIPVMFMFGFGQIDLAFVALIPLLKKDGWKPAIAASLITLKPQIALTILPWFLVQWVKKDRETFSRFIITSLAIHLLPIIFDPSIYKQWILIFREAAYGETQKFGGAGIWLFLKNIQLEIIIMAFIFTLLLPTLITDEKISRVILTLGNPILGWYDTVILIDLAPWWLLAPISIFALIGSHLINQYYPMILIPLSTLIWVLKTRQPRLN